MGKEQPRRRSTTSGLTAMNVVAFVPTMNFKRARAFYEGTLGLGFVSEDDFALVFDAHGIQLRVVNVATVKGFSPAPFTILGWEVPKIDKTVKELSDRGIRFERFPGMQQIPPESGHRRAALEWRGSRTLMATSCP